MSDGNYETLLLTSAFYEKELRLVGSSDGWDYSTHPKWFLETTPYVPELEELFEQTVSSDDLVRCFEQLQTQKRPLKVSVTYPAGD
ncbi:hypothetical protein QK289_10750 [Exiguobacterium antarcticum]|uniref:Uncharacterized protein n=1 Tax=Exiguobacterium antarcticum TaxID=132920 RepID=A0ABT6R3G0_9BACL|nr:hypothetical protein [Exiguobacterium antarcticum]MDI3235487.1 hypothetical protein [Exiguobacterium antarcticum]